jgi:glutamate N-acetyltransferase / amino-acid N-acetyltransferase
MELLANGSVTTPRGFRAGVAAAQIKYKDRLDTAVLVSEYDCSGAAVFTQNQVVAPPVIVDRATLRADATRLRAVVANAGVANACTGEPGLRNARATQRLAAEALGCEPQQVLVLSTGVIGMQLPMERLATGIRRAAEQLDAAHGPQAAQAIMTTDTHPKHTAVYVALAGGRVAIGGMAKGAGMIHPNMATLLGVLTTDAAVAPELLDALLRRAVNASFNRISIDGDTSTNDTVLLLANGAGGVSVQTAEDAARFEAGLTAVCVYLAHQIVRDGEGATKFVEIQVCGAPDAAAAHAVANTIATSPLVKTAFAGSDANWGRILAAAGRAGIPFDQNQTSLWIGGREADELQLVRQGTPTGYLEADAAAIFARPEFSIRLDLGGGTGADTVWTCDLSHAYVAINADYRT